MLNVALSIFAAFFVVLYMLLGKKKACSAWYALCMLVSIIFVWANTMVLELFAISGLISRRFMGGWIFLVLQWAWTVKMLFCPWIRTTLTDRYKKNVGILSKQQHEFLTDDKSMINEKGGNIVLLCNHTSFMDTPQCTRFVPRSLLWHCRGYVGEFLLKIPLFGRIIRGIGHFPVCFKSSESGNFSVDKDKMAVVEKIVDEHLALKGMLTLFPEGQVNGEPENGLMDFRFGTFVKALQYNFRLWAYTSINNEKSWPKKAPIGGLPADLFIDLFPLAPNGAKQLVKDIRDKKLVEGCEKKEDYVILAEYCHDVMEKEVHQLRVANAPEKSKKED